MFLTCRWLWLSWLLETAMILFCADRVCTASTLNVNNLFTVVSRCSVLLSPSFPHHKRRKNTLNCVPWYHSAVVRPCGSRKCRGQTHISTTRSCLGGFPDRTRRVGFLAGGLHAPVTRTLVNTLTALIKNQLWVIGSESQE